MIDSEPEVTVKGGSPSSSIIGVGFFPFVPAVLVTKREYREAAILIGSGHDWVPLLDFNLVSTVPTDFRLISPGGGAALGGASSILRFVTRHRGLASIPRLLIHRVPQSGPRLVEWGFGLVLLGGERSRGRRY